MDQNYARLDGTHLQLSVMRNARVAVAGLGAVGSEVVKNLGLSGAAEVLLIDPDTIEPSNLSRGFLYRNHIGESKALALAEEAARHFPDTRWVPAPVELADLGWGRLNSCAILFSAVDRDSARLELARIATRLNLPVCEAGLSTDQAGRGRVTWYPANPSAACFGCRLTAARRRELLSTWRSPVHPCAAAPAEPGAWSSTPTMASIVGSLLVDAGIRAWQEKAGSAFSLELEIAPEFSAARIEHLPSPGCPFHEGDAELVYPGPGPFAAWMGDATISWEWSLCVAAACLHCGLRWRPCVRVARFLQQGCCPECGSRSVRLDESLRQVAPDSSFAFVNPEDLGLPADHLYTRSTNRQAAPQPFEAE